MSTYAADAWAALGDPSRRQILQRLAERPRSVTEIAEELPISRPAVSQHLRVLKEARLVLVRPVGTRRIYEVDLDGLAKLHEELDQFWGYALKNFKRIAEMEQP
ncbi:ArsR/SmtB family transcription factor [Amycolatopsis magusensis]|uniref:DNA-binding transcriptional ArsR family regulator n=1 Tax=Amycolatopsis magusensis TaxID=882444 RepID=A0ABS4PY38_9PSEU|nr:metalloregulator ArsR/SmtB family transcription factor [Amycolatopsis magusensis]MBP2183800.1 DNA-binding transcriptional ArsR family regulator [Amycolatopsis magusensis]